MDIIKTEKKGKHLDTLEKYLIYKISRNKLHTNDTYTDTYNPIFEALHQIAAHTLIAYIKQKPTLQHAHNIYTLHTRKATGIPQKYNACGTKRETTLDSFLELTEL
jgi:hypothetical protein